MKKLRFKGSPLKAELGNFAAPENGVPFIYLLTDTDSKEPFYIGEYGKASTYNVITRIQRHFAKSGTLARVALNMPRFGHQLPGEFDAYIKELSEEFKDHKKRAELEAWVIHVVCHQKKVQSSKFCVTKYVSPENNYSQEAQKIADEFAKCS